MGVIKMRRWEIILVRKIAIPILKNIIQKIKVAAEATQTQVDDVIVNAIEAVIAFLEDPETFEET
ncbi:MAG: hypothetical protein DRO11_03875 [Methanobacteriota archaeon]|nr:MAG: hypothetical protein DRO11_03875 [Euryarchaeota archaeon]